MPSGPDDLHSDERMALWRRARHAAVCRARPSDGTGAIGQPDVLEGPGFLYRPQQILVETGLMQTAPVESVLQTRYGGKRDGELSDILAAVGLPIEVFIMPPQVYIPGLVAQLRERPYGEWGAPAANVSPNHVFCGEVGDYHGGPYGDPTSRPEFDETRYPEPAKGAPVIAVLDTGYDTQIMTMPHPGLKPPRVTYQEPPENILDGQYLAQEAGHGTFIEGILMQQAPQMNIIQVPVLTPDGVTDDTTVGHAIAALGNSAAVINISLGGYTLGDTAPPTTSAAVAALPDTVVVVAAAGNNGSSEPFWPAAEKTVVAVGALDTTQQGPMKVAGWSNYGNWVDVYAPGVNVYSTYLQGDWKLPSEPAPKSMDGYAMWSGTSFTAPQVAAAIANEMRRSGVTARQAAHTVLSQAQWLPVNGLRGITGVYTYIPSGDSVIYPA